MIRAALAALLTLAFGGDKSGADKQAQQRPQINGTVTFHQQIIIVRTPAGARPANAAAAAAAANAPGNASRIRWEEHRGPRCIAWARILGAGLLGQNSVDLIFRDGTRVRARLERRCPALDYYRGFYINETEDGMICADRDSIHSRAGGECGIDAFRSLRPRR